MPIDYESAAIECAYFVYESEWVQDGYTNHIEAGNDPRDHILYSAAIILGKADDFQDDVNEYLKEISNA